MDVTSTWIPTWHSILNVSWSAKICARYTPRSRPNANFGRSCEWYGVWMRIKGPHNHMVKTLGLMCEVALRHCKTRWTSKLFIWLEHTPHTLKQAHMILNIIFVTNAVEGSLFWPKLVFPLNFPHVPLLHQLRPSWIPCENYISALVKMK